MKLDPYRIATEPYYQPLGNEIETFEAAYAERLPVMLKARPAAARRGLSSTWPGGSARPWSRSRPMRT